MGSKFLQVNKKLLEGKALESLLTEGTSSLSWEKGTLSWLSSWRLIALLDVSHGILAKDLVLHIKYLLPSMIKLEQNHDYGKRKTRETTRLCKISLWSGDFNLNFINQWKFQVKEVEYSKEHHRFPTLKLIAALPWIWYNAEQCLRDFKGRNTL